MIHPSALKKALKERKKKKNSLPFSLSASYWRSHLPSKRFLAQ